MFQSTPSGFKCFPLHGNSCDTTSCARKPWAEAPSQPCLSLRHKLGMWVPTFLRMLGVPRATLQSLQDRTWSGLQSKHHLRWLNSPNLLDHQCVSFGKPGEYSALALKERHDLLFEVISITDGQIFLETELFYKAAMAKPWRADWCFPKEANSRRVEQDRMQEMCKKLRRPADNRGTCQGIRPAVNVGLSVSRDMPVFIPGISSNLPIQLKCNEVNNA